jgi:general stress protein 26
MAAKPLDPAKAEKKLWKEIGRTHAGMLGLVNGPGMHFKPMVGLCGKDHALYFFTRRDAELAKALEVHTGTAMFTVAAEDKDLFACIGGELSREPQRLKAEALWRKALDDWLPEGRTDPNLIALRLDVSDAEVWLKRKGPARLVYRAPAPPPKHARKEARPSVQ